MEIAQKEKIYSYSYKIALSVLILFFLYNIANILFISHGKGKELSSNISGLVDAVKYNMIHSQPSEEEVQGPPSHLPSVAKIERALIFAGPDYRIKTEEVVDDDEKKFTRVSVRFEEILDTWITFKGVAKGLTLINVRRDMEGQVKEHSFTVRAGERIGGEMIRAKKTVNLTTNCVLQDIIVNAQRSVTLKKKVVILDEEGGYIGTRLEQGEKFKKTVPKIVYTNEEGEIKELWLGQETQIVKKPEPEEEKTFFEESLDTVKDKFGNISETLKAPLIKK